MTGCDTITLKRFKIPFGAVEMTQKLKAHTVLPEVLVLVLRTHPRQLTLSVSPGNLPVSSSPPDITCNVVPMYAHTQTQNTKIFHSSPFCLPPSLPPLLSSLYLFPSLSPFEKLVYFFAYSNMDNKVSMRAVGIPAEAVGIPGSTLGRKEETMVLGPNQVTHPPMCHCGRVKQTISSHREQHHLKSKHMAKNIREDWLCEELNKNSRKVAKTATCRKVVLGIVFCLCGRAVPNRCRFCL